MDRKLHLLETFTARGSDGATYKVHGYELMARDDTFIDPLGRWEPTGLSEYRLANGEHVDLLRDGSLRAPRSGLTLTRQ